MTVVEGGLPPAQALTAAENTAASLSVKVLRSAAGSTQSGLVRGLDLKACRSVKLTSPSASMTPRPTPS